MREATKEGLVLKGYILISNEELDNCETAHKIVELCIAKSEEFTYTLQVEVIEYLKTMPKYSVKLNPKSTSSKKTPGSGARPMSRPGLGRQRSGGAHG